MLLNSSFYSVLIVHLLLIILSILFYVILSLFIFDIRQSLVKILFHNAADVNNGEESNNCAHNEEDESCSPLFKVARSSISNVRNSRANEHIDYGAWDHADATKSIVPELHSRDAHYVVERIEWHERAQSEKEGELKAFSVHCFIDGADDLVFLCSLGSLVSEQITAKQHCKVGAEPGTNPHNS